MKKLFVVCFSLCVSFALVACAGEDVSTGSSNSADLDSQVSSQTEASASTGDSSGQGDLDVYSRTEGTWFLNGDTGAGYVFMDGAGAYELYDSEGASLSSGNLHYTDENDKFMMQAEDLDDVQYDTFYFEDETTIVFEGSGSLYTRQSAA